MAGNFWQQYEFIPLLLGPFGAVAVLVIVVLGSFALLRLVADVTVEIIDRLWNRWNRK